MQMSLCPRFGEACAPRGLGLRFSSTERRGHTRLSAAIRARGCAKVGVRYRSRIDHGRWDELTHLIETQISMRKRRLPYILGRKRRRFGAYLLARGRLSWLVFVHKKLSLADIRRRHFPRGERACPQASAGCVQRSNIPLESSRTFPLQSIAREILNHRDGFATYRFRGVLTRARNTTIRPHRFSPCCSTRERKAQN